MILTVSAKKLHKNLRRLVQALPAVVARWPDAVLVMPGNPTAHERRAARARRPPWGSPPTSRSPRTSTRPIWRACTGSRAASCSRRSTRASGSRSSRRCAAASPSPARVPPRCPRSRATRRATSTRSTSPTSARALVELLADRGLADELVARGREREASVHVGGRGAGHARELRAGVGAGAVSPAGDAQEPPAAPRADDEPPAGLQAGATAAAAAGAAERAPDVLDTQAAGGLIIRGGVMRLGSYVVVVLLSLIPAVLLTRYLGAARFSAYTTVISLVSVISLVTDAGMSNLGDPRIRGARRRPTATALMRDLLGLRVALTLVGVLLATLFAVCAGYSAALLAGTVVAGLGTVALVYLHTLSIPLAAELRLGHDVAAGNRPPGADGGRDRGAGRGRRRRLPAAGGDARRLPAAAARDRACWSAAGSRCAWSCARATGSRCCARPSSFSLATAVGARLRLHRPDHHEPRREPPPERAVRAVVPRLHRRRHRARPAGRRRDPAARARRARRSRTARLRAAADLRGLADHRRRGGARHLRRRAVHRQSHRGAEVPGIRGVGAGAAHPGDRDDRLVPDRRLGLRAAVDQALRGAARGQRARRCSSAARSR